MTARSIGLAALLLVMAAALGRPAIRDVPAPSGTSPRRLEQPPCPAPRDAVELPQMAPLADLPPITDGLGPARRIEQDAEESFWAKVREMLAGDRGESLLDATARYLGWGYREKVVSQGALRTIDDARRARDLELSSGGQETYERVKQLALFELGFLLDESRDRHRRFRDRLEEWVDAMSAVSARPLRRP
jgi:hypothetical protein